MAKLSYINQLSSRKCHKYAGLHLTLPSLIVETRFDPGFQHVRLTVPEVNWTVRLNRAGSKVKFRRGGGGIWSLMKRSGSQQTIQHICSEGVGDLIPYQEKWKSTNHSTYLLYLFREGGGFDPLWRLDSPARKRPRKTYGCLSRISGLFESRLQSLLVSPESSVFGGCRSSLIMFDLDGRGEILWVMVRYGRRMSKVGRHELPGSFFSCSGEERYADSARPSRTTRPVLKRWSLASLTSPGVVTWPWSGLGWENHGKSKVETFETHEFLYPQTIRGFLWSIILWESWGLRQHWCSEYAWTCLKNYVWNSSLGSGQDCADKWRLKQCHSQTCYSSQGGSEACPGPWKSLGSHLQQTCCADKIWLPGLRILAGEWSPSMNCRLNISPSLQVANRTSFQTSNWSRMMRSLSERSRGKRCAATFCTCLGRMDHGDSPPPGLNPHDVETHETACQLGTGFQIRTDMETYTNTHTHMNEYIYIII